MIGPYKSNSVSGTTGASAVNAVTVDTRGCGPQGKLNLMIKNAHASNTMYYTILGYPADPAGSTGIYETIKSQTSIAAATTIVSTDVAKCYAAVVVQVVNNSGACPYQIDYCTY